MKQLIWTAVFQVIDLLQVLFKEYVIDRSGFEVADNKAVAKKTVKS